eukprot:scaffold1065_cov406-Prasinococcus_capsulatus_cf.AAC.9
MDDIAFAKARGSPPCQRGMWRRGKVPQRPRKAGSFLGCVAPTRQRLCPVLERNRSYFGGVSLRLVLMDRCGLTLAAHASEPALAWCLSY